MKGNGMNNTWIRRVPDIRLKIEKVIVTFDIVMIDMILRKESGNIKTIFKYIKI